MTVGDRWKVARIKSYDMFIYGPNTINTTTPPPTHTHRMTVMTPVRMMNTTLEGTRINQANKKSPECPPHSAGQ